MPARAAALAAERPAARTRLHLDHLIKDSAAGDDARASS
jgi:hypothetical protein